MLAEIHSAPVSAAALAAASSMAESLAECTLDIVPAGIVLIDADTRILHRNAAAEAMLKAGTPIFSHQGQLRPTSRGAVAPFVAAAKQAALGLCKPTESSASIPLPCHDGRAAIAHVRPLKTRRSWAGVPGAAVFITEPVRHAPPPLAALMVLFGLTKSEARVLEQIAAGKRRREAAAALGLADATVATHLQGIFSKTGTSDQFSLCRMVAALSWPGRI